MKLQRDFLSIHLTPKQAKELNLPHDHEYVRSACYLGMPYMEIQNRVAHACYQEERDSVIYTAKLLGMTDQDQIFYPKEP